MPRSVPEWIGKNDDSTPPPRVKLRVFDRHGGRCALCGGKIQVGDTWECDHATALACGGSNSENNLRPVHTACHRDKTKQDVAEKSKVARIRKKHLGIKKKSGFRGHRKFNGEIVWK